MKLDLRETLRRLSNAFEMLVGLLMIGTLFIGFAGLVLDISPVALIGKPSIFSEYLSVAATLVIGVEFVKMLYSHTLDSVIEIMLLAIARQMIVEHTSPLENFCAVVSIAVLFLVRKFLFISQLDAPRDAAILTKKRAAVQPQDKEGKNDGAAQ